MPQEFIHAYNRKYLKKHPKQEIYNITRTFANYNTPKKRRVYRVTSVKKGSLTKSGKWRKR